jgi:hypothetical protein
MLEEQPQKTIDVAGTPRGSPGPATASRSGFQPSRLVIGKVEGDAAQASSTCATQSDIELKGP